MSEPRAAQLVELQLLAQLLGRGVPTPADRSDAACWLITLRGRCDELELVRPTREEIDAEIPV